MKKYTLKLILGWAINIFAIYLSSMLLNDFNYGGWRVLVLAGLGFSFIASLTRPFLKLLSLPFPVIGIFLLFVLNSAILFGLGVYVKGFYPGDMTTILEAGGIISIVNFVLHLIIR